MAKRAILLSPSPRHLLEEAAEPLIEAARRREREAGLPLLLVANHGLRNEIEHLAALSGVPGWLGRPVLTLQEFIAPFTRELLPLSDAEREILVRRLLRETPLVELGRLRNLRGLVRKLDRLFGELVGNGATPRRLRATLEKIAWDGVWEKGRDRDVVALHRGYLESVEALPPRHGLQRIDGRGLALEAARVIRADPDRVATEMGVPLLPEQSRRLVVIHGMTRLAPGWKPLLEAMSTAPFFKEVRITVLESGPGEATGVGATSELLRDLRDWGGSKSFVSNPLPQTPRPLRIRRRTFPDPATEVRGISREMKKLIVEEGVPPEAIALMSRHYAPHMPLIAEALREAGVPATAHLQYRVSEIPIVRALLRAFEGGAQGWTRSILLELASSPYMDTGLDAGLLNVVAGRNRPDDLAGWRDGLRSLHSRTKPLGRPLAQDAISGAVGPARVRRALEAFEAFAEVAARLERPRGRAGWLDFTIACIGGHPDGGPEEVGGGTGGATGREGRGIWGLVEDIEPASEERLDDPELLDAIRTDLEGIGRLAALLGERRVALSLDDAAAEEVLTPGEWRSELLGTLAERVLYLWTPQRRGVRILDGSLAGGRSFEHLFVAGLEAGSFPFSGRPSGLFRPGEMDRLGDAGVLSATPGRMEEREEASFRALVAGARRSVTLSYNLGGERDGVNLPSPFFEDIENFVSGREIERSDDEEFSRLVPRSSSELWSIRDLRLFASAHYRDDSALLPGRILAFLAREEGAPWLAHLLDRARMEEERSRSREALTASRDGGEAPPREAALHAWNGELESGEVIEKIGQRVEGAVWSASRLERYGLCPFLFLCGDVLQLGVLEEPGDELAPSREGLFLHRALERMERRLYEEFGQDAFDLEHSERGKEIVSSVVSQLAEEPANREWTMAPELHPSWRENMTALLEDYILWEMKDNEASSARGIPRRRPWRFEFSFGAGVENPAPVVLRSGDRKLSLRGRIDRVDILIEGDAEGWLYVVDHKLGSSGITPVKKYEEGAILQLPLYILALEALARMGSGPPASIRKPVGDGGADVASLPPPEGWSVPDLVSANPAVWGGSYQIVRGASRRGAIHPRTLTKKGLRFGSTSTEETALLRLTSALDHALDHLDGMKAGHFPARIPNSAGACPRYCPYREICREYREGAFA